MAAWLVSALKMLAGGGLFAAGTELATSTFGGVSPGPGIFGDVLGGIPGFGQEKKKRRRRRRALTSSDKVDIAFIAGILGKPAGKDIAAIIAART